MAQIVTTHLVNMDGEQGVRIPKSLLEQAGLTDAVQIEVDNNRLILRSAAPRQGWEEQFRQMAASGDDTLLDADAPALSEWDNTEWEWE